MSNISEITPCSVEEIQEHLSYLQMSGTPWWISELIGKGTSLSKGMILSRNDLGMLYTWWDKIGGIPSKQEYAQERFLVNQALSVARDPRCDKEESQQFIDKIEKIKERIRLNTISLNVTILDLFGGPPYIVDGNHRVVAYYETQTEIHFKPLHVFLIH